MTNATDTPGAVIPLPLWKRDDDTATPPFQRGGTIWRLHVGNHVVASLLPAARACGLPVHVMLIHTDWPDETAPHCYNASEWDGLEDAKDFLRRLWVTESSKFEAAIQAQIWAMSLQRGKYDN